MTGSRRRFLEACGVAFAALPGCLGTNGRRDLRGALSDDDAWRQLVVDPPNGAYVPAKVDAVRHYGTATAGPYAVALVATRPHSFWTVTDAESHRSTLRSRHALHLMASAWDRESKTVVPTTVTVAVRDGDQAVSEQTLWPMLSQRMGFHYGDNVSLEDDGTYTAALRVDPLGIEASGAFADRFAEARTVEIDLPFDAAEIEDLERTLVDADEGRGEPGALEPMSAAGGFHGDHEDRGDHEDHNGHPPLAIAPPRRALPGDLAGVATGDDVVYAAVAGSDPDAAAAVVSPRTRYNSYSLPFASLSATIRRDGAVLARSPLEERLDPAYGHHYALPADAGELRAGDELEIAVETGPQVARHEGYETAFFEEESVRLVVEPRDR